MNQDQASTDGGPSVRVAAENVRAANLKLEVLEGMRKKIEDEIECAQGNLGKAQREYSKACHDLEISAGGLQRDHGRYRY